MVAITQLIYTHTALSSYDWHEEDCVYTRSAARELISLALKQKLLLSTIKSLHRGLYMLAQFSYTMYSTLYNVYNVASDC